MVLYFSELSTFLYMILRFQLPPFRLITNNQKVFELNFCVISAIYDEKNSDL